MKIPPIPYYAPSGTPIGVVDIVQLMSAIITGADRTAELADAIREQFKIKHCFFVSTGRAAMAVLLDVLKELSTDKMRDRVILPSYTCYSVPASVAKAGLHVDIADVDYESLSYNQEQLENIEPDKSLAVLSANLYGIPNDLTYIERFARDKGLFFVDDAAQCMGATFDGRYAGTFGDAGLYSLDKGKNITSIQGGIIVTSNEEIAARLNHRIAHLANQSTKSSLMDSAKLILYAIFLHPSLYWIPASAASLNLGKTVYTTEYPIERYNSMLSSIAYRLFSRLKLISQARIDNARYLIAGLGENPAIRLVKPHSNGVPVYLRLPVFIEDEGARARIVDKLNSLGISATVSYPESIADLKEVQELMAGGIRPANGGRRVARTIVTLPTHQYMNKKSMDVMLSTINSAS